MHTISARSFHTITGQFSPPQISTMPPKRFPTLPSQGDENPPPKNRTPAARFPTPHLQTLVSASASANSTINNTANPAGTLNNSTFSEEKSDQLLNWIDKLKLQASQTFEKQRHDTIQFRKASQLERLRQKYRQSIESPSFDKLGDFLKESGESGEDSVPGASLLREATISANVIASRALQYRDSPYPEAAAEAVEGMDFENLEGFADLENYVSQTSQNVEEEEEVEEEEYAEEYEEYEEYEEAAHQGNGNSHAPQRVHAPAYSDDDDDDDVVEILSDESAVEDEPRRAETRTYQPSHGYNQEQSEEEFEDEEEAEDEGESIDLEGSEEEEEEEEDEDENSVASHAYSQYRQIQPESQAHMFVRPSGRPRLSDHVTGFTPTSSQPYGYQPQQESEASPFDSEDLDEVSDNLDAVEDKYSDDLAEDEVERQLETRNYSESEKESYYAQSGKEEEFVCYGMNRRDSVEDEDSEEPEEDVENSVDEGIIERESTPESSSEEVEEVEEVEEASNVVDPSANFFEEENLEFHQETDIEEAVPSNAISAEDDPDISRAVAQSALQILGAASNFYAFSEEGAEVSSGASVEEYSQDDLQEAEVGEETAAAEAAEDTDEFEDAHGIEPNQKGGQSQSDSILSDGLSQEYPQNEDGIAQEYSQLFEDAESSIYEDSALPLFDIPPWGSHQGDHPLEGLAQAALVDAGREDLDMSDSDVDVFFSETGNDVPAFPQNVSSVDLEDGSDKESEYESASPQNETGNESHDEADGDESMVDAAEDHPAESSLADEGSSTSQTTAAQSSSSTPRFLTFQTIAEEDPKTILKQLKKTEKKFGIQLDAVQQLTNEYGEVSDSGTSVPSSPESLNDFYDVDQPESPGAEESDSTQQNGDEWDEAEGLEDTLEIEDITKIASQAFEMKPEVPVLADISGDDLESDISMDSSSGECSESDESNGNLSEGVVIVEPVNEEDILTVFDDFTELEEVVALVPSAVEEPPQTPMDELAAGLILEFESDTESEVVLLQPTEIIEPAESAEFVVVETFEETTEYAIPTSIEELESRRNTPAPEDAGGRTDSYFRPNAQDTASAEGENESDTKASGDFSSPLKHEMLEQEQEPVTLVTEEIPEIADASPEIPHADATSSQEGEEVSPDEATEETENDISLEDLQSYEKVETDPDHSLVDDFSSPEAEDVILEETHTVVEEFTQEDGTTQRSTASLTRKRKIVGEAEEEEEERSSSPVKKLKSALSILNPFSWGRSQETAASNDTSAGSSESNEAEVAETEIVSLESTSFEFEVPSDVSNTVLSRSASPESEIAVSSSAVSADDSSEKESPNPESEAASASSSDENESVDESEDTIVETGSPPVAMHDAESVSIDSPQSLVEEEATFSPEDSHVVSVEPVSPADSISYVDVPESSEDTREAEPNPDFIVLSSEQETAGKPSDQPVILSVPPLPRPDSFMRIAERNRIPPESHSSDEMDIFPGAADASEAEDEPMYVDSESGGSVKFEDSEMKLDGQEMDGEEANEVNVGVEDAQDETSNEPEDILDIVPDMTVEEDVEEEISGAESGAEDFASFERDVAAGISNAVDVPQTDLQNDMAIDDEPSSFESQAEEEVAEEKNSSAASEDAPLVSTEDEPQMEDHEEQGNENLPQTEISKEGENQTQVLENVDESDAVQVPTQDMADPAYFAQTGSVSQENSLKPEGIDQDTTQLLDIGRPAINVIPPSTENLPHFSPEAVVESDPASEQDKEEDNATTNSDEQDSNSGDNAGEILHEQDNGASAHQAVAGNGSEADVETPSSPSASGRKLASLEKLLLTKAEEMILKKTVSSDVEPHEISEETPNLEKCANETFGAKSEDVKSVETEAIVEQEVSNHDHVSGDASGAVESEIDPIPDSRDELRTPFTTPKKTTSPRKKPVLLTPIRRSSRLRSQNSDLGEAVEEVFPEPKSEVEEVDKPAQPLGISSSDIIEDDEKSASQFEDVKVETSEGQSGAEESSMPTGSADSVIENQVSEVVNSQNEPAKSEEKEINATGPVEGETSDSVSHEISAGGSQPSEVALNEKSVAEIAAPSIDSVEEAHSDGSPKEERKGDNTTLAAAGDSLAIESSGAPKVEDTPIESPASPKRQYADETRLPQTPKRSTRGSERLLNLEASTKAHAETPVQETEREDPGHKPASIEPKDEAVDSPVRPENGRLRTPRKRNAPPNVIEASSVASPGPTPQTAVRKRGRPRKEAQAKSMPLVKKGPTGAGSEKKKDPPKKKGRPRKTPLQPSVASSRGKNPAFVSSPVLEPKEISEQHNHLEVKVPGSPDHPAQRTRSKSPIKRSIQELSSEINEEPFKKRRNLRNQKAALHADAAEAEHELNTRGRTRKR